MVKSILVALDGSQHADSALDHGLWLAHRLKARLIGLHVLDIVSIEGSFLHDVSGSLGFEPYLDFSSKMREALQERGTVLLDAFRARCEHAGVDCDTALPMGIVANEICDQARTRRPGRRRAPRRQRAVLHRLARQHDGVRGAQEPEARSGHPHRIQARRAVRCSPTTAPSGPAPRSTWPRELSASLGLPLTVLHVGKEAGGESDRVLAEAQRYLQSYEVPVTVRSLTGPPHQRIVDVLRDGGYDLLFIGAYGHSRIIEMVLGSTTEFVLRNTTVPVFLSR